MFGRCSQIAFDGTSSGCVESDCRPSIHRLRVHTRTRTETRRYQVPSIYAGTNQFVMHDGDHVSIALRVYAGDQHQLQVTRNRSLAGSFSMLYNTYDLNPCEALQQQHISSIPPRADGLGAWLYARHRPSLPFTTTANESMHVCNMSGTAVLLLGVCSKHELYMRATWHVDGNTEYEREEREIMHTTR